MTSIFHSKFEKRYVVGLRREQRIQNHQERYGTSRDYAVRYSDYLDNMFNHNLMNISAGSVFYLTARKWLNSYIPYYPFLKKPYIIAPIFVATFYLGHVLYDKLTGYYLNQLYDHREYAHHWLIDYASKYKVTHDPTKDEWFNNIPVTPFEQLQRDMASQMKTMDDEGEKTFKRMSKDKDDFYWLFGKIRNLENIIYISKEELEQIVNPVQLQMKIDSVKPDRDYSKTNNQTIEELQNDLEDYKFMIENSKNFRSVKDKLLGLPFMMLRHRQLAEPVRGTWQFDLFEEIFNESYDYKKGDPETEEKINKYNYHTFLHPSIIKKHDTNSEEFDMYLRLLNVESKTNRELRIQRREYYCKYIMPHLNFAQNKEEGVEMAYYIVNQSKTDSLNNYLFNQYSGQNEEKLFREAEEKKFLDKNQPYVHRTQYSTVAKKRIGIKSSELEEIMKNPTKFKKIRKALENNFPSYEPVKYIDKLKNACDRSGFVDTMIRNKTDVTDPKFDPFDLFIDTYESHTPSDEEAAMRSYHLNHPFSNADQNTYPYGEDINHFYYSNELDWNDYQSDFPEKGIISPKVRRYELYSQAFAELYDMHYLRQFNNPKFADMETRVYPYKDEDNEEYADKVFKRDNLNLHHDEEKLRDSEAQMLEFLEKKTEEDSFEVSDDVTEEQLDQAIFEASYSKPDFETDEYRSIKNKNPYELEAMFKLVNFIPFEQWNDPHTPVQQESQVPYTDKIQYNDPLYHAYSEVEHPTIFREYIKKWRTGAELRFKLAYYPDVKKADKTFNYV